MLDYVSSWKQTLSFPFICPSSHPPSVYLDLHLIHGFSNFSCTLLAHVKMLKCFQFFSNFSSFFIHMGPYGRKYFQMLYIYIYTPPSNQVQIILHFYPEFSSRRTSKQYYWVFWIYQILSFQFLARSAWLSQQISWNRNLSVVRPSVLL